MISVDGFGDFASTAWGVGIGANIEVEGRIFFPHSLGIFYQALTQYLGFPNYGDEYKVMGLAPYGKPTYLSEMRNIVRLLDNGQFELETDYFRHHKEKIDYEWDGVPRVGLLYSPKLEELLGAARQKGDEITIRHCNIAHSVQLMYETAFFNLLNSLHAKHGIASLTIAGGCGMNSVANGKVILQTPFKRLYVQPAAGDAGGAIGAAVYLWHKIKNKSFADVVAGPSVLKGDQLFGRTVMDHAYFGPAASNLEISDLLKSSAAELDRDGCTVIQIENERGLCKEVAKALAAGEVVGWFQGRMEWGPRALGNRSILSDPRRIDMKELLNKKIKRREDFRPFAPSIQSEHAAEWFETDDDVPFMMQVYQIRKEKQKLIPAVAHVDGSGRLQMVYRETNQLYWELIEAFRELTGIPILLNTSFNENEPIVCRPVEALNCFRRTKMDRLVIGSYLIKRV
ncbi:hypothetical protein LMG27198_01180 [Methylocystis echinoides]|uniref:Carbamoyltransferase n=1 Tax=Methylocystis echinoides TaxID=29468 RepID=A0A9W6GQN5_9HYPH|nr:hypothetical protein LMG27198_01180 [Methylocystis echinoides]